MLQAASFADMLDGLEFLDDIGRQDERLVAQVQRAKLDMRSAARANEDDAERAGPR